MQADQAKAESQIKETALTERQKLDQYAAKLNEEQRQLDYEKEIFKLQKELDAFKDQQEAEMEGHVEQTKQMLEAEQPDLIGGVGEIIDQMKQEMAEALQSVMNESTKKPTHIQKVRDKKGKMVKAISFYEDGTNRETNFVE